MLRKNKYESITQRIQLQFHLTGLNDSETTAYVRHQMQIDALTSPVFADSALQLIYKATQGVSRLINHICTQALFVAERRGSEVIEGKHTGRILADLEKQVGADCLSQVIIQESNACVPNYWPWALVFPMVGVRILIDLALYRLISNAIDVEIEHDKEGERLRGTSEW